LTKKEVKTKKGHAARGGLRKKKTNGKKELESKREIHKKSLPVGQKGNKGKAKRRFGVGAGIFSGRERKT